MGQAGDKSEHMFVFISVGSAGDRVLSNHIQCRLKKTKKIHAESNVRGPSPERERPHRNVCSPLSVGNFFFFSVCSSVFVVLDGICSGTSRAGTVPEDLVPSLVYVIVM